MASPLTTKVSNYDFAYYDSGAGNHGTVIVIHGNTYHAGAFLSLFPVAPSFDLRVILVQRRLYPGSTPYTEEETRIITAGTETERKELLDKEGELLALFVDNMIQEHSLGKVAVAAWSQGTGYLNTIIDALDRLEKTSQERLQEHVCAFIHWDPPSLIMGLRDPPTGGWTPLFDYTLSPDERASAFGKWLTFHFPHPDLASRDPATLIYKMDTPLKPLSFANVPIEEFLTMVDFAANSGGEYAMGEDFNKDVMFDRYQRAMLNPGVRKAWRNTKFCCIYGDESPWSIQWSVWNFEKHIKEKEDPLLEIHFRVMKGANHLVMSDDPKLVLSTMKSLID